MVHDTATQIRHTACSEGDGGRVPLAQSVHRLEQVSFQPGAIEVHSQFEC